MFRDDVWVLQGDPVSGGTLMPLNTYLKDVELVAQPLLCEAQERIKMYKFEIRMGDFGYFISDGASHYLHPNLEIKNSCYGGWHKTKKFAEETLNNYLEKKKMKNYMMIDDERIDISDETAQNLKEKFGREKTYKAGSIWRKKEFPNGEIYRLIFDESGKMGFLSSKNYVYGELEELETKDTYPTAKELKKAGCMGIVTFECIKE